MKRLPYLGLCLALVSSACGNGDGGLGRSGGDGGATSSQAGAAPMAGTTSEGGTTSAAGATSTGGRMPLDFERLSDLDAGVGDAELYSLYIETLALGNTLDCFCQGNDFDLCVTQYAGRPSRVELECAVESFFADANGRAVFECRQLAEERFVDCVFPTEGNLCNTDCLDAYFAELDECPELSDETWLEFEDRCIGREPFTCDGGATVLPQVRLCDLTSDCADGADEAIATCR